MSKENVKLFFEKLQNDMKLQGQFEKLANKKEATWADHVVKIAAESGYEFSCEQMDQLPSQLKTDPLR